MRKPLVLIVLGAIVSLAQNASLSPSTLRWKNVSSRYMSFNEIRPVLVNDGKESVFLSRIWPHGSAQLQRFNVATGEWETGDWGIGCGTVKDPTIPIEIKPQTERRVHVYWQLSSDDWNSPKHFVVGNSLGKRPREGRYRFFLRYSLKPWTLGSSPGTIYTIASPEFLIVKPSSHDD
jgi:hypothetical protein